MSKTRVPRGFAKWTGVFGRSGPTAAQIRKEVRSFLSREPKPTLKEFNKLFKNARLTADILYLLWKIPFKK